MLIACTRPAVGSAQDIGQPVCGASENLAVCFFANAIPQGDSDPAPLLEALRDAINLPLEELRAKRYTDVMGEPNKWTFEQVIGSVFTGSVRRENGELNDPDTKGFIEAVKQPEALPVLKKILEDLERHM